MKQEVFGKVPRIKPTLKNRDQVCIPFYEIFERYGNVQVFTTSTQESI